jgi:hypothetical protein
MIDRDPSKYVPHLAKTNAFGHHAMLTKLVASHGGELAAEIKRHDVAKLLNIIAKGRARPSKDKPNNRARKLWHPKPSQRRYEATARQPTRRHGFARASLLLQRSAEWPSASSPPSRA